MAFTLEQPTETFLVQSNRDNQRLIVGSDLDAQIRQHGTTILTDKTSGLVFRVIQYEPNLFSAEAFQDTKSVGYVCKDTGESGDGISSHRYLKAESFIIARKLLHLVSSLEGYIPECAYSLRRMRFYLQEDHVPKFFSGTRYENHPDREADYTKMMVQFMIDGIQQSTWAHGVTKLEYDPPAAARYLAMLKELKAEKVRKAA